MARRFPLNLMPSSLLGQVMASVTLALLVAQIVSASLLFRASEERREAAALTALAFQLSVGGERPERFRPRTRPSEGQRGSQRAGRRMEARNPPAPPAEGRPAFRLPRELRYVLSEEPPTTSSDRPASDDRVERLRDLLEDQGIRPAAIRLITRQAGEDPSLIAFAKTRPRLDARQKWRERPIFVAAIQRSSDDSWETARVFEAPRPSGGIWVLLFQTLVLFAFLIGILFLVLRRITRPLAALTKRVDDFSQSPESVVKLEESGPADTRRLIAAHNAMEARVAALLDEKDVMLGAIGHDLKTPLAALRVRIESVPDEAQRARMAAIIEDITRTLDDILELARIGRAHSGGDGFEPVDIGALADSVVEEFEDLGEPVTLDLPEGSERLVARVQQTWFKRAMRNLISNAVRYGKTAHVRLRRDDAGGFVFQVEDEGPGILPEEIEAMLEPFTRGDASRNRATGGTGLGLTLARAIAEAHGGELRLENRVPKGLNATITLPA